MQQSTAHAVSRSSAELTACLRLSRGSSERANWLLGEVAFGSTLTVGADPSCDWQIRAANVAPHALSVLLIDGSVFIAAGPNAAVSLDGARLPEAWTQVVGVARIDVGMARLTLSWDERPSAFAKLREVAQSSAAPQNRPVRRVYDSGPVPVRGRQRAAARADTPRVDARARSSWTERFSRPSLPDTPAVLRARPRRSKGRARVAALSVLTALAYASFLLWLDWM